MITSRRVSTLFVAGFVRGVYHRFVPDHPMLYVSWWLPPTFERGDLAIHHARRQRLCGFFGDRVDFGMTGVDIHGYGAGGQGDRVGEYGAPEVRGLARRQCDHGGADWHVRVQDQATDGEIGDNDFFHQPQPIGTQGEEIEVYRMTFVVGDVHTQNQRDDEDHRQQSRDDEQRLIVTRQQPPQKRESDTQTDNVLKEFAIH